MIRTVGVQPGPMFRNVLQVDPPCLDRGTIAGSHTYHLGGGSPGPGTRVNGRWARRNADRLPFFHRFLQSYAGRTSLSDMNDVDVCLVPQTWRSGVWPADMTWRRSKRGEGGKLEGDAGRGSAFSTGWSRTESGLRRVLRSGPDCGS